LILFIKINLIKFLKTTTRHSIKPNKLTINYA
jgi:hypothetical protein